MSEIINLIKNNVLGAISNNENVSADKKDEVIKETTGSIIDGLKNNLSPENMSEIKNLFSGDSSAMHNNPITNNIQGNVISTLMQKVGLSDGISSSIASTVVPLVIKAISGKMNGDDFNISSFLNMISGNDKESGAKDSGIIGKITNLFN